MAATTPEMPEWVADKQRCRRIRRAKAELEAEERRRPKPRSKRQPSARATTEGAGKATESRPALDRAGCKSQTHRSREPDRKARTGSCGLQRPGRRRWKAQIIVARRDAERGRLRPVGADD
jgi:hypothetical protein